MTRIVAHGPDSSSCETGQGKPKHPMRRPVMNGSTSGRSPLPFLLDHFLDPAPKRRSHRRRLSEFFVHIIPAFVATGDMLFDSEHFGLGEFLEGIALHRSDDRWATEPTISKCSTQRE